MVKPSTIDQYISELPNDRRESFVLLRDICKRTLEPLGYTEYMQYNFPSWSISHETYPAGYHCDPSLPLPFVSIGNQK